MAGHNHVEITGVSRIRIVSSKPAELLRIALV